ncbi:hypothetical protein [Paenibacillus sabinae]|uniref:Uncharacterized protein n=1 Tax=Paenibacillus sabinae T27 TaxID=1268072 RepID=X4ZHE5_9BACL|nr:hypothetical protein [Paenibacillus sabinae]AHV96155.1 hypothetical protein PSAB_06095 [Paenibacillus sabinae T27]
MVTTGDLLPTIKKLTASFVEEIGSNDTDQNFYLFQYINHALRKLASVAYNQKDSDLLAISGDGYVTFKKSGQDITNMYAPLRILDPNWRDVQKRVSFADTRGWWRESYNTQIHIKGIALTANPLPSGNYTLQYIAYPAAVSSESSLVEFPDAGTMGLCYYCSALIVESLDNAKDLAAHYYSLADSHLEVATQANIEGRGTSSGGYVPSLVNAQLYRNQK